MKIKNKVSIELLDWISDELKNEKCNFKKIKKIVKISINHNKKYNKFWCPSNYYVFDENENRLYYYFYEHYMSGVVKENYEVIFK